VLIVVAAATRHGAFLSSLEMVDALRPIATERVVLLRDGGDLEDDFRRAADVVDFEPLRGLSSALQRRPRTDRIRRTLKLELIAAKAALRRWRPSMLYVSNLGVAAYAVAGVALGIPTILHVREALPNVRRKVDRWHLDRLPELRVAAVSRYAADNYAQLTGIDPSSIALVPSPVDPEAVRRRAGPRPSAPSPGWSVVACGSGLYPAKGFDLWIEMCRAIVRDTDHAWRFTWIGEPPAEVSGATAELVRDGRLVLTGAIENPFPLIAAADIVVVPSRWESFSRVTAESMALARPIVAFAVGGIPELLGDAGVLIEPGDTQAMARAVVALGSDVDARRELGEKASVRVLELDLARRARLSIQSVVSDLRPDRDRPGTAVTSSGLDSS
jgi:hypothetical protein